MIVTTTDPITGKEVRDPEGHPFLIEGEGEYALKIYFESEATKRTYLDNEAQFSDDAFS
jgi:YHS domain-containing protein